MSQPTSIVGKSIIIVRDRIMHCDTVVVVVVTVERLQPEES